MQESTAFDEVMEEGELRGELRGELKGRLVTILQLGRMRFGPAAPVTEATLNSIKDRDRLARIVDAILTAESWEELLATP